MLNELIETNCSIEMTKFTHHIYLTYLFVFFANLRVSEANPLKFFRSLKKNTLEFINRIMEIRIQFNKQIAFTQSFDCSFILLLLLLSFFF